MKPFIDGKGAIGVTIDADFTASIHYAEGFGAVESRVRDGMRAGIRQALGKRELSDLFALALQTLLASNAGRPVRAWTYLEIDPVAGIHAEGEPA